VGHILPASSPVGISIHSPKIYVNGGEEECNRILVGKPNGKRPLGRPRCRWEDNIRMDLREIGWGGLDWIDQAQDGNEPLGSIKCWEILE
jgi:hypothetical protein